MPVSLKLTPAMIFSACFDLKEAHEIVNPYRVWLKCGKVGSTTTAKKPVEAWLACERGEVPSEQRFQDLYDKMKEGERGTLSDQSEVEHETVLPETVVAIIDRVAREVWEHASERIEQEVQEANEHHASIVEDALTRCERAHEEIVKLQSTLVQVRTEQSEEQEQYDLLHAEHEQVKAKYQELTVHHELLREECGKLRNVLQEAAEEKGRVQAREQEYERYQGSVKEQSERDAQLIAELREEIKLLTRELIEKEGRARAAEERVERQLDVQNIMLREVKKDWKGFERFGEQSVQTSE